MPIAGGGEARRKCRPQPDTDPENGMRSCEVLAGSIGVLGLRGFADFEFGRDDQPARKAIDAALRQFAHADAVVFDLRGNRGGSPAMVGYLASAFAARGAAIFNTFHSRAGTQSEAPADRSDAPRPAGPRDV